MVFSLGVRTSILRMLLLLMSLSLTIVKCLVINTTLCPVFPHCFYLIANLVREAVRSNALSDEAYNDDESSKNFHHGQEEQDVDETNK